MLRHASVLFTLIAAAPLIVAQESQNEPHDSLWVEKAKSRLVQIEVVVRGPTAATEDLGPEDFGLWVANRTIEFEVDRLRSATGDAGSPLAATYVFYFDQSQLTPIGRQHSLELARDIVPRVITGVDRGMVVSGGRDLKIYAGPTTSAEELLEALDRLDRDAVQRDDSSLIAAANAWDVGGELRYSRDLSGYGGAPTTLFADPWKLNYLNLRLRERHQELQARGSGKLRARNKGNAPMPPKTPPRGVVTGREFRQVFQVNLAGAQVLHAQGRARVYNRDAMRNTEQSLERLRAFLVRMDGIDRPKSLVYFADRLRFEPGEALMHATRHDNSLRGVWDYFEAVRDTASATGVRFYTVDGRGLVARSDAQVQDALSYFALESGGRAFLNGVAGDRIAERLLDDVASTYLLSFDPEGLPTDKALFMTVKMVPRGLTVSAPAHLFIRSGASRDSAEMLAAFVAPDDPDTTGSFSATLIPTGYRTGKFHALVQISTSAVGVPRSTWDLGASLVSRGKVRDEASRRIEVDGPGVPVTFEREMTFAQGDFELIAIAHHLETDRVASGRIEGAWPNIDKQSAVIGPIAVVQPSERVLVRDDVVRTSGSYALGPEESARTDLPTGLVTVVCAGPRAESKLVVLRTVEGETAAEFDAVEIDPGGERCAVLSDVIPAQTLREGWFRYTVEVRCGDEVCATAERGFGARQPGL